MNGPFSETTGNKSMRDLPIETVDVMACYQCRACKAIFEFRETAEKCYASHKIPDQIIKFEYKPYRVYPARIKVQFRNGTVETYYHGEEK